MQKKKSTERVTGRVAMATEKNGVILLFAKYTCIGRDYIYTMSHKKLVFKE